MLPPSNLWLVSAERDLTSDMRRRGEPQQLTGPKFTCGTVHSHLHTKKRSSVGWDILKVVWNLLTFFRGMVWSVWENLEWRTKPFWGRKRGMREDTVLPAGYPCSCTKRRMQSRPLKVHKSHWESTVQLVIKHTVFFYNVSKVYNANIVPARQQFDSKSS